MRALLLLVSSTALGAGMLAPREAQPLRPRPSLDEQLEEWRGRCDALAGEAMRECLGRGDDRGSTGPQDPSDPAG